MQVRSSGPRLEARSADAAALWGSDGLTYSLYACERHLPIAWIWCEAQPSPDASVAAPARREWGDQPAAGSTPAALRAPCINLAKIDLVRGDPSPKENRGRWGGRERVRSTSLSQHTAHTRVFVQPMTTEKPLCAVLEV